MRVLGMRRRGATVGIEDVQSSHPGETRFNSTTPRRTTTAMLYQRCPVGIRDLAPLAHTTLIPVAHLAQPSTPLPHPSSSLPICSTSSTVPPEISTPPPLRPSPPGTVHTTSGAPAAAPASAPSAQLPLLSSPVAGGRASQRPSPPKGVWTAIPAYPNAYYSVSFHPPNPFHPIPFHCVSLHSSQAQPIPIPVHDEPVYWLYCFTPA
jgi:hypothetical protein